MSASASPIVLGSVLSMTCTCRPSTVLTCGAVRCITTGTSTTLLIGCAQEERESWNWRVYAHASEPMRLCTILSGCASPGSRGLCLADTVGWRCISCCPFTPARPRKGPRTLLVESNTSQTLHTFHDRVFVEHCLSIMSAMWLPVGIFLSSPAQRPEFTDSSSPDASLFRVPVFR